MKKGLKITGITFLSIIVLILAAGLIIPAVFKDTIKEKVENAINKTVNATVSFDGYRLSLFKAFPSASFSLENLSVTGKGDFEGDTLAAVKSAAIIFNLKSLFGEGGYEVRSLVIDEPFVNAIVNNDGKANWDIAKESEEPGMGSGDQVGTDTITGKGSEGGEPSDLKLMLRKLAINRGRVNYTDHESDMQAAVHDLDFLLSGNMSGSQTNLNLDLKAAGVDFIMEKIPWLTDATVAFNAGIDALLDSMKFTLRDNVLKLNDIALNFSGTAAMPGDDIDLDMVFSAPGTSFKSLLSLVPAFYMKGYEDLKAAGTVALDGAVKGVFSSADSTLPDVLLNLKVSDGLISYPALPEKISEINIDGKVQTVGSDMDKTVAEVSRFHFVLAGNPFDISLTMATPLSDPAVNVMAKGRIDLAKLQQAVPLDSVTLNGLLDVSLDMAGRMSMIENREYEKFRAAGSMNIADMAVAMAGMPDMKISKASFSFSPAFAELTGMNASMGEGSDFSLSGRLENYIPYLFSDGILRGNLSLKSDHVDLNEIMEYIPSDTVETDTVPMEVIRIPEDIDFTLDALVGTLNYGMLAANDIRGNIVIREGVVTVSETGMKALGGSLLVNAVYDTRDTLKPAVDAEMLVRAVSIKDAFGAFKTVKRLMPAAEGLGGNVSAKIDFSSILGTGMMPLLNTLSGTGEINSESVQVLQSTSFDRMKNVLKIDPAYTNILKDIRATFIINDGRLWIKPFDTKLGRIKLNVSGDQGLDQTINYLVKAEIPREELGQAAGALMSTFASQAAALGFSAAPPEVIRVNLNVGGTVGNPAFTPSFAGGSVSSAVTALADTVKSEVTEKVNEAARQQADRIMKEAEDNAKVIREKASSSAETIRSEADLRGKKLIKDAEASGPFAVAAAKKAAEALNREADKRATQIVAEANKRADEVLATARTKADEILR